MTIEVIEATEVDGELLDAMERLVPQLSTSNPPPTFEDLTAIVTTRSTVLLLARDTDRDGEIVGSLTLVLFRIPTGLRAWIEDVMVDESAARRGIATQLSHVALDRARDAGAVSVDLTSRPSREAANNLYKKLGFVARETNVYRYSL